MLKLAGALAAATAFAATTAHAQAPTPDEAAFRSLYKELVETNTSLSVGSCTLAAERMAAHLKAAGFADSQLTLFTAPDHPKEGGLVAIYPGKDPKAKAILLLAHLDVVEAKREDWTRDPFTLVEENGYFYARGSSDDKAQAAIWVDTLSRYRKEGYRPRHTIKMALTCGEETSGALNGAEWLSKNRRELIDAAFALNEGAGGQLDEAGKPVVHTVLAAEKMSQNYRLEVTNPGGHSSQPVPDNAIYHLARALDKISRYEFPVMLNDANRGFFSKMAKVTGGETGAAMTAIVANPADAHANEVLSRDKGYHSMLRTTCVATMLDAGHATNALPQRARANINCRIFPGVSGAEVEATLVKVIDDPAVHVSVPEVRGAPVTSPPLTPQIMGPIEKISGEMWPGTPVIPLLQTGATDGQFLTNAGIPTYGVSGLFGDRDGNGVHGLNERMRVKSLMDGRTFLYRLVKAYADQP
ncbi:MAG TPA: M20/M25/M40 family metallo-hydrolase [Phenylobacterium sp.]|jgi:acetylornithine deacetylase/succinyl-diaminopimelate desuccinylase-like protein